MLQPITYSLIINFTTLVGAGVLAYLFAQPWLFMIAILLSTHALERFREEPPNEEPHSEYDGSGEMGFTK